jgi:hypothetical protein
MSCRRWPPPPYPSGRWQIVAGISFNTSHRTVWKAFSFVPVTESVTVMSLVSLIQEKDTSATTDPLSNLRSTSKWGKFQWLGVIDHTRRVCLLNSNHYIDRRRGRKVRSKAENECCEEEKEVDISQVWSIVCTHFFNQSDGLLQL